jgi:Flp pilus assembly protein TadB
MFWPGNFTKEEAMPNELPPKDLKTVWQNQDSEGIQMSIDEIRTKARSFERKIRRRNLREYIAAAFIAAGFAFFAWHSPSPIIRLGNLTVAVGALFFAYQLHLRGSSRTQPKEMGTMGGLDFYLGQLERERTLLDESWKWMIWLIPGMIVLMAGVIANGWIGKAAPFLAITCLWIGIWLWMMLSRNKRRARALQQEIDELSAWGRPLP